MPISPCFLRRAGRRLLAASFALLGGLCVPLAASEAPPDAHTGQLLVVVSTDWDAAHGRLYRFQRQEGEPWQLHGSAEVSLGRTGTAWGTGLHPLTGLPEGPHKREGDGRSPAGIFEIGPAFGYARNLHAALPYLPMDREHWCIDVPASPLYNTIVDSREVGAQAVAGSTEPMRLDLHKDGDIRYRLGFVIRHNPDNTPGGGSCIFAHLRRAPSETTAGCTALDADDMQATLHWLDSARRPRLVLLPAPAYAQLQQAWQLPALPGAAE
jgi:L,D-peptidoglycan transpeptidase YkuD (ErfK/YbiS/YcfS/YnhG family)